MRKKSIFLPFMLLLVTLTSCINTVNLREGIISFKRQDYRQAFIRLMPEAEKGQADAQYAIGYMYYYGQGVLEDRKKAYLWICRAADAGQPDAIKALQLIRKK